MQMENNWKVMKEENGKQHNGQNMLKEPGQFPAQDIPNDDEQLTMRDLTVGYDRIPLIKNINQLCVIEKGTLCGAVMTGDYNLIDTEYKSTLQNLVNRVIITNSKGNQINVIEDAQSIQKYGLVQKVMKQSDKEDISAEAQKALVSVENSGSVSGVPNDFRAVSGYSIIVQDEVSGLYGQFYIESDTHTFTNGKAQMDLTLAFENLMDEEEIEKDTNNKKSKLEGLT